MQATGSRRRNREGRRLKRKNTKPFLRTRFSSLFILLLKTSAQNTFELIQTSATHISEPDLASRSLEDLEHCQDLRTRDSGRLPPLTRPQPLRKAGEFGSADDGLRGLRLKKVHPLDVLVLKTPVLNLLPRFRGYHKYSKVGMETSQHLKGGPPHPSYALIVA